MAEFNMDKPIRPVQAFLNRFHGWNRERKIYVERNRGYLSAHFDNIQEDIRKAITQAKARRTLILGAGNCRDIPLAEIASSSNEVFMVDLDIEAMKEARSSLSAVLTRKVQLVEHDISLIASDSASIVDECLRSSVTREEFVDQLEIKLPKAPESVLSFVDNSMDLVVSSLLMPSLSACLDDFIIEAACGKFGKEASDQFSSLYFSRGFTKSLANEIYRKHIDELSRIVRPDGRVVLVSEIVSSGPLGNGFFTLGYSDLTELTKGRFEALSDRHWDWNRPPFYDHQGEDVDFGSRHRIQSLILKKKSQPQEPLFILGSHSPEEAHKKEFHVNQLLDGLKGISNLLVDKSLLDAKRIIKAKLLKFLDKANQAKTATEQNFIIDIMLEAIGRHHPMTLVHQREVVFLAELIAKEMNLDPGEIDLIKRAALLHDIGKLGETEELLNNTDELSEEERTVIQQHVVVGALLLHEISWLKDASLPVYFSHYYKNYPAGIGRQKAPLSARIVAVADSFNAMVSERKYQMPMTPWKAVHKLRSKIYDQKIVDVLGKVLIGERYEEIKLFSAIIAHEINNALGPLVTVQFYKELREDKEYKKFLSRFNEITLMVHGYIMGTSDLTVEELLPSLEQKVLSSKPVLLKLCEAGKISASDISDMERAIQRTLDHIRRYMKFDPIEILMLRGQSEQALAKFKLLPKESRLKKLEEICQRQTERANEPGGFRFGSFFVSFLKQIMKDAELKEETAVQEIVQKTRSSIKDRELIRQLNET